MTVILCTIFFLSGAAALLFESLWFYQAGLAFGSGVWASSLVLAGFMAGLALGNALAARAGDRFRAPLQVYGVLELCVGFVGVALVFGLPALTPAITSLLKPVLEDTWLANPLRFAVGGVLLLLPSTAMGATLPALVRALLALDPSFGSALGRLYGWNTLGAVIGAIAGEAFLIERLGIRGTGLLAGGMDLLIAVSAFALSGRLIVAPIRRQRESGRTWLSARAVAVLAATFIAGGILLALEVAWFRFLQLFFHANGLVFSVMLGVVLAGIGCGSLAAGALLRRRPESDHLAAWLPLLAGAAVVALYALFSQLEFGGEYVLGIWDLLPAALLLMFPVSLISGALFTGTGSLLRRMIETPARATGWLTLANTLGSGLGSLVGGFLLLPMLGIERTFETLAIGYGVAAALLFFVCAPRLPRRVGIAAWLLFGGVLFAFPDGLMERRFLAIPIERWGGPTTEVAAYREGRTETLLYLRTHFLGETLRHRLVTDGYSMSANSPRARRYMKAYVYWPLAFHPEAKRALLISYGVGSTARALVDSPGLERIDVVDISRDILELSAVVFPGEGEDPLIDPRVRTYVEDGRYFLQTTEERYDLITGEPPPPKNAGVVSLYTEEYFALVRDRLNPGGIHTYWLPVHNLAVSDAKAIVRAYCNVFDDCSLWVASGMEWMLVGSRSPAPTVSAAAFRRQWDDPGIAQELVRLGLDSPALLGAMFLGDRATLDEWTVGVEPLIDDRPMRLGHAVPHASLEWREFGALADASVCRERFEASPFIAKRWPAALRGAALRSFPLQQAFTSNAIRRHIPQEPGAEIRAVHAALANLAPGEPPPRGLLLLLAGTSLDEVEIVERRIGKAQGRATAAPQRALAALVEGDPLEAASRLARLGEPFRADPRWQRWRVYALAMAQRPAEAERVARRAHQILPGPTVDGAFWRWLETALGVPSPYGPSPGARSGPR